MTVKLKSKNPIAIKICGITDLSQAKAIAEMGVNAIGVIGVESSRRFIPYQQREFIFSELSIFKKDLERVLVVADLDDSKFDLFLNSKAPPTIVQLHGSESIERCSLLRKKYKHIKWWKAIRIKTQNDFELINSFKDEVDGVLIDAWSSFNLGGTGYRIPLEWINKLKFDSQLWIAGGISEEWIPQLLERVKPYGIDASSKLEKSPGVKDLKKVKSLIKTVRNFYL